MKPVAVSYILVAATISTQAGAEPRQAAARSNVTCVPVHSSGSETASNGGIEKKPAASSEHVIESAAPDTFRQPAEEAGGEPKRDNEELILVREPDGRYRIVGRRPGKSE